MQTSGLSRKVGLTILIILTVLLLILSVIIAIRLQGDTVPSDNGAAGGGTGSSCTPGGAIECASGVCCPCNKCAPEGGNCSTVCQDGNQCQTGDPRCSSNGQDLGCQGNNSGFRCKCVAVTGGTGCPDRLVANCGTQDASCGGSQASQPASTPASTPASSGGGGNAQSCPGGTWTYSGNCIQVLTGSCQLQRFSGSGCPTTTHDDGTAGSPVGTYCPSPAQGSCQQVDVVGSGQGVCSCAANPSTTATSRPSSTTTTVPSTTTESTTTTTPPEELPDTALISESFDRVLMGITLLIFGALVFKFELVDKFANYAQVQGNNLKKALDFETKRRIKSRERFEDKFEDED